MFRSSVFILLLLFLMTPGDVFSGDKDIKSGEEELQDVKRKLRDAKKSIKETEKKESSVLGELQGLSKELKKRRVELKRAESDLRKSTKEKKKVTKKLYSLKKEREKLEDELYQRLRAFYKMQKGAALNVIFEPIDGGGDAADILRRYKYMNVLVERDNKLIEELKVNIEKVNKEQAKLAAVEKRLRRLRDSSKKKKIEVEKSQKMRKALLRKVRLRKASYIEMQDELKEAGKELTVLLRKLKQPGSKAVTGNFASMKGRLDMPVGGKIVSRYGKVKHPKFKTIIFNNGIIINAAFGSEVRGVFDGTVAYVGWLKGYGQVMIVEHGSGYYSLFAHLSTILKEKGSFVMEGEVLALVGESGTHESPGLYFEIRKKDKPIDPLKWIKKG
ncbi:MAG: peptidoglycan DD-metalloendopeptidase family protein [Deltaproteobacteria bacterium]|nr:peptidoglycan DD-metalloendopeptidase family protein [Deltaproteobacteria bacterium]